MFYHSCSHDKNPQHDYCPKDIDTWCPYNRAVAEGRTTVHDKPPRVPPHLAEFVKVCWEKFCDPDFLQTCVLGATTNPNESFNSLVWKYCRKTDFSGPEIVHMATNLATLTFNKGMCSLIPLFELLGDDEVGQYTMRYLVERDKKTHQRFSTSGTSSS